MAKNQPKQPASDDTTTPSDPVAALRSLLLEPVPEDVFLDLGRGYETDDVLTGASTFCASAAEVFTALSDAARAKVVGFAPPVLDLIKVEAQSLRTLQVQHDAITASGSVSRTKLRTSARLAASNGVVTRDQAAAVLRRVLAGNAAALDAVATTVGTAETSGKLVAGLRGLGALIRSTIAKAPAPKRAAYAMLQLNEALAASLDQAADDVAATAAAEEAPLPDDRVTQRALDLQDGRVLYLVKLAHDAFRHARNRDATILLPDLGNVRRLHDTRLPSKAATTEPTQPPEAPPSKG